MKEREERPRRARGDLEPAATLPPDEAVPEGPAFVLVRKPKGNFLHSNPFAIRREIDSKYGTVMSVKALRSGPLLVETKSSNHTHTLLNMTSLRGSPVTASLAERMNTVEGSIRADSLTEMSNKEILEELEPQGVCRVQRLRSRDVAKWGPNPTVRLSFRGRLLPLHVYCGYEKVAVNPWVPMPRACQHCWNFGHHAKACRRRKPRCGKCSESHETEGCEAPLQSPHCAGPHPFF